jgi:hypothetical protein
VLVPAGLPLIVRTQQLIILDYKSILVAGLVRQQAKGSVIGVIDVPHVIRHIGIIRWAYQQKWFWPGPYGERIEFNH